MEKLMSILAEIRPDLDFENQKNLITEGILDSFDIISIVSEINDVFNINISAADMLPDNFNDAFSIWHMIEKYRSNG